jgi:hypothetical protein
MVKIAGPRNYLRHDEFYRSSIKDNPDKVRRNVMTMAFIPICGMAAEVKAPEVKPEQPSLPIFTRKWYHRFKLDIRPVCWSLRNRPEEWERQEVNGNLIMFTHKPSSHYFYTNRFHEGVRLRQETRCGCTAYANDFTALQRWQFSLAANDWWQLRQQVELIETRKHFEEHFVGPAS